jgi:hypothetical protein
MWGNDMPNYPSFDISIDLGQTARVKCGNSPGEASSGQVDAGSNPQADVVAEVLFKLAFAVLNDDPSIPLTVNGSIITRDSTYRFPPKG